MHVYLIARIVAPALASACASPPHVDAALQPRPAWNIAAHAVRVLWDAHWRYTARRARRGGRLFWRVGRGRDPRRPRIVYRLGRIVSRPLALPAIELWRANPSRCGCAADLSLSHSFLWKAHGEDVSVFKWTGKNDYVALCEPESISFGGGCAMMISYPAVLNIIDHPFSLRDGHYGLYLDETLYEGSSARCPTFNNDPLSGPGPDGGGGGTATFECVGLEVWGVAPS